MRCGAGESEVGKHFADHARELEAVAREAGGDGDLWVRRMKADDEVVVGRHRVEADLVRGAGVADVREMIGEPALDGGLQGSASILSLCEPKTPHLQQKGSRRCTSEQCE